MQRMCCALTTSPWARPGAEFAARLGVDPVVVPDNHLTLLNRPEIVADALISVL